MAKSMWTLPASFSVVPWVIEALSHLQFGSFEEEKMFEEGSLMFQHESKAKIKNK